MIDLLRQKIINDTFCVQDEISNIIYNVMQHQMRYNIQTDRFEMYLIDIQRQTSYFSQYPDKTSGKVQGTNVFWEIVDGKFTVWLNKF